MNKQIVIWCVFCSLFVQTSCIKAQQEPGQIVINAGVGYSPEFDGQLVLNGTYYPVNTSIPNFNGDGDPYPVSIFSSIKPNEGGSVDIGISKAFSIGFAASYQSVKVSWAPGSNGQNTAIYLPYSDKITRINKAVRFLFHLPLKKISKHFDIFLGCRLGLSYWNDTPSLNNGTYGNPMYYLSKPSTVIPSFQVLAGLRYYPTKIIGIHVELGIGSPYLFEGGITFAFNMLKNKASATTQDSYGGHEENH